MTAVCVLFVWNTKLVWNSKLGLPSSEEKSFFIHTNSGSSEGTLLTTMTKAPPLPTIAVDSNKRRTFNYYYNKTYAKDDDENTFQGVTARVFPKWQQEEIPCFPRNSLTTNNKQART